MGGMDDHSMGHSDDAPEPMTDMMGMGDMDLAAMPEHVQKKPFTGQTAAAAEHL